MNRQTSRAFVNRHNPRRKKDRKKRASQISQESLPNGVRILRTLNDFYKLNSSTQRSPKWSTQVNAVGCSLATKDATRRRYQDELSVTEVSRRHSQHLISILHRILRINTTKSGSDCDNKRQFGRERKTEGNWKQQEGIMRKVSDKQGDHRSTSESQPRWENFRSSWEAQ